MDRACVLCGTPGRPDRFSCQECGAAIVEVRRPGAATAGAPGAPAAPAGLPWEPAAEPAPPATTVSVSAPRERRAPFAAYVMSGLLVVALLATAVLGWRAYGHSSPAVPSDLRAYTHGDGDVYAARGFTVRLPYGYIISSFTLPWEGRNIAMTTASATSGSTTVVVATGLVDDSASSQLVDHAPAMAARVAREVQAGGAPVSSRRVNVLDGSGYDVVLKSDGGPDVAVRLVLAGRRVVCLVVVSPKSAEGGLRAVADSYEPG
jgi:hypothetical protein